MLQIALWDVVWNLSPTAAATLICTMRTCFLVRTDVTSWLRCNIAPPRRLARQITRSCCGYATLFARDASCLLGFWRVTLLPSVDALVGPDVWESVLYASYRAAQANDAAFCIVGAGR